jgi:2-keto-4-pentenoate hydratase/2-oxohepta-3-ene-1,7-dioic acid hydratase in catechol pathway
MRIIRYQFEGDSPRFGWVLEDKAGKIEGDIFSEFQRMELEFDFQKLHLLPPVVPSKVICVGRNYAEHAREHDSEIPDVPLLFLKPPSSIIGNSQSIILPPQSQQVEHEAELVVVIKRRGRWIQAEDALSYILGYTIGNDVTARDLQRRDNQWTRAKGFDTFCAIGPWIETDLDPSDVLITCYVNDEMRQMASTHEMVFNVRQLIAYASSIMTLEPGDILFTGTPAGVSPIQTGDVIAITIDGIGTLTNPVMSEPIV